MPRLFIIRRWLQRLNAGLLIALVTSVAHVATHEVPPEEPIPPQPKFDGDVDRLEPEHGDAEFERFLRMIRRFHGRPRTKSAAPIVPAAEATRLPLRAFRPTMAIGSNPESTLVLLKPKDPACRERYWLALGQPDRDARLEWIKREQGDLVLHVRRGKEQFTFRLHQRDYVPGSGVVAMDRPTRPASDPRAKGTERPALARQPRFREVKTLPFYGEDGTIVGMRVCGVKPGSHFERIGLRAGDVITQAESESVLRPTEFRSRIGSGWLPKSLTVKRSVQRAEKTVVLRGG